MMIRFIKNFHLGKIFKLINLFFIPWNLRTVHFTLPRLFTSIVKKIKIPYRPMETAISFLSLLFFSRACRLKKDTVKKHLESDVI